MSSSEDRNLRFYLNPINLLKCLHQKHLSSAAVFVLLMVVTYVPFIGRAFMIIHGSAIYKKLYLWTAVILLIVIVATIVIYLGWRIHQSVKPIITVSIALVILTYVIIVEYNQAVEIFGFALVGLASWWDYRAYKN